MQILDRTFSTVDLIQVNDMLKPILPKLAIGYAKIGQKNKALQFLEKALNIAQSTIQDESERVGVLAEVANHYAQLGQQQKASDILAQALKAAEDILIGKQIGESTSLTFAWFKYPCDL
ncbi:MAG: tetratricopeptide repeat protein [Nostoc sp. S4]|nr:tetratricopeptide repeat protein [Nostoc sp. S4]